jgi:hypothetical protein
MVDEAFALSPISARAVQPSEEDYDAISQAFMETSRGRWFLGEYAKRNRNSDTHMVLEAVARIETTLAGQKQQVPGNELADALATIRNALDQARALASVAIESLAIEHHLAPIRKGSRVIKEISWRWREIGADARMCDLIDSQLAAIDAGCEEMASIDPPSSVATAFDLIGQQLAQLQHHGTASAQASEPAAFPARLDIGIATAITSAEIHAKPVPNRDAQSGAGSATASAGPDVEVAEGSGVASALRVEPELPVEPEPLVEPELRVELERIAAQPSSARRDLAQFRLPDGDPSNADLSNADLSNADFAKSEVSKNGLPRSDPAKSGPYPPDLLHPQLPTTPASDVAVEAVNPASEVADATVEAVERSLENAETTTQGDQLSAEMAEIADEVARARDDAILKMVATEMAAPDDSDEHGLFESGRAPLNGAAVSLGAPILPAERTELAASPASPQPAQLQASLARSPRQPSPPPPQPESLGSSLIAHGIVRRTAISESDPLAPIRRMSQAEKIAFFS